MRSGTRKHASARRNASSSRHTRRTSVRGSSSHPASLPHSTECPSKVCSRHAPTLPLRHCSSAHPPPLTPQPYSGGAQVNISLPDLSSFGDELARLSAAPQQGALPFLQIDCKVMESTRELKERISERCGNVDNRRALLAGNFQLRHETSGFMKDDVSLAQYNVEHGCTLQLKLKSRKSSHG